MSKCFFRPLAISALVLTIAACGGGGATPSTPSITVQGNLDPAYGSSSLSILSSFSDSSVATASNGFSVEVSADTSHLLAAQDSAGKLKAFAVWIPKSGGIAFNAESTAQSLVFAVPRIYSSDPAIALSTLSAIHELASFPTLRNLLKGHESEALDDLLTMPTVIEALKSCIEEWFSAHPSGNAKHQAITADFSNLVDLITLNYDDANPSQTKVHVENTNFRILEVCERDVAPDGTATVKRLPSLSGAGAISLGNIFGSIGEAASQDYMINLGSNGAIRSELYFRGTGKLNGVSLPNDVATAFGTTDTALLKTIFWYGLLPLIDTAGGFANYLEYSTEWLDMMTALAGSATIASDLNTLSDAIAGDSIKDSAKATAKLTKDIFGVLTEDKDTLKKLLIKYFTKKGYSPAVAILKAVSTQAFARVMLSAEVFLEGMQLYEIAKEWQILSVINMASLKVEGTSSYAAEDIGTLGGHCIAKGFNRAGFVVGQSVASDGLYHAFFRRSAMLDLKWLGSSTASPVQSVMYSINDTNVMSGSITPVGQGAEGYTWNGAFYNAISGWITNPHYAEYPYSINATNDIAGQYLITQNGVAQGRAFSVIGSTFRDLHSLVTQVGDVSSSAIALNDSGQIAGTNTDASGYPYAYFFDPSAGRQTIYTGGGISRANALSNTGFVTGEYSTSSQQTDKRAFIWKDGAFTPLVYLDSSHPGGNSGRSVDLTGTVIGDAVNANGETVACLWKPGQAPKDINKMVFLPGVKLFSGVAINTKGYLLCLGDVQGTTHSYILRPN